MSEDVAPPPNKLKAMLGQVLGKFKALKLSKGAKRPARLNPVHRQLRNLLWAMLVLAWAFMGKFSYDMFHKNTSVVAEAEPKKEASSRSLYPWTKGYSFGHDIVEPVVQTDRGLAAAIDERDLKVTMGARYVEFRDIEAVVKAGMGNHSKVLLSMAFEVDSYPAEQEVLKKELKIREIVTSTLSTKDKDLLTDYRSVAKLKEELLKKLALVISSGLVTDVLITAVASN